MSAAAPVRRRTSVSYRLIGGLAALTLLVSVVVSAAQLAFDYQRRVDLLQQQVEQRVRAVSGSLAGSVWSVDPDSTRLLLDGLKQLPGVARVELRTLDAERIALDAAPAEPLAVRTFELRHAPAGNRGVGTLVVTLDEADIRQRVLSRMRAIALTSIAGVAAGCVIVFLLYQRLLVRHLERIASYARKLDLSRLDQALVLDRPASDRTDELDLVVAALDRMRARMSEELAIRQRHEEELEAHREHLSQLVDERTAALSERNAELHTRTLELEAEHARAERLANTDHLTGLGNRRHFYEAAEARIADALRAARAHSRVGVLMLDIDHFKQVNDRLGHASGDRVLATVASRCRDALPAHALVGRLGGEEFAALVAGIDAEALHALAERVRVAVSREPIPIGTLPPVACTVSIGTALGEAATVDIDRLLGRGDEALYAAKRGGRDRVVAWSDTGPLATAPPGSPVRRRGDPPAD